MILQKKGVLVFFTLHFFKKKEAALVEETTEKDFRVPSIESTIQRWLNAQTIELQELLVSWIAQLDSCAECPASVPASTNRQIKCDFSSNVTYEIE